MFSTRNPTSLDFSHSRDFRDTGICFFHSLGFPENMICYPKDGNDNLIPNLRVSGRHFFYNDKSWNGKRYLFANVKSFWHLMWKTFCHSGRENSIKTNLETCNLWTGQYVSYKSVNLFWLNLPHQNGKTFFTSNVKNFSHLQMNIVCYFDFCHCRRNAFWTS